MSDEPTLTHPLTTDITTPHSAMVLRVLHIKGIETNILADENKHHTKFYWSLFWGGNKYQISRKPKTPITNADLLALAKKVQEVIDFHGPDEAARLRAWNRGEAR